MKKGIFENNEERILMWNFPKLLGDEESLEQKLEACGKEVKKSNVPPPRQG